MTTIRRRSTGVAPSTGWGVLLALVEDWGTTLRTVTLAFLPIAAIVALVSIVAIYLGPVGIGALLTAGGSGYGVKRAVARRRRRRARRA